MQCLHIYTSLTAQCGLRSPVISPKGFAHIVWSMFACRAFFETVVEIRLIKLKHDIYDPMAMHFGIAAYRWLFKFPLYAYRWFCINESRTKTQNARAAKMCTLIFHFSNKTVILIRGMWSIHFEISIAIFTLHSYLWTGFFCWKHHWFKSIGLIVCHLSRYHKHLRLFFAWLWNTSIILNVWFFLLDLAWSKMEPIGVLFGVFSPFFISQKLFIQPLKFKFMTKCHHKRSNRTMIIVYDCFRKTSEYISTHFQWNCMHTTVNLFKC